MDDADQGTARSFAARSATLDAASRSTADQVRAGAAGQRQARRAVVRACTGTSRRTIAGIAPGDIIVGVQRQAGHRIEPVSAPDRRHRRSDRRRESRSSAQRRAPHLRSARRSHGAGRRDSGTGRRLSDFRRRAELRVGADGRVAACQLQRHGRSVPTRMPIRGDHASRGGAMPWSSIVSGAGRQVRAVLSQSRCRAPRQVARTAQQSCADVVGVHADGRIPRRRAINSTPSSGSSARISTAAGDPSLSVTALTR